MSEEDKCHVNICPHNDRGYCTKLCVSNMTVVCVCVCACVSGSVYGPSPDCLMKITESFRSHSSLTLTCRHHSERMQVRHTSTHTNTHLFNMHVRMTTYTVCCCVSEPLGGVVEGLSAGMFLIGMTVAVVSLLVYRQRLRKV